MARLAFAIDGSIDIWDLRYGYSVGPDIAQAIYPFIGRPALIYRNTEVMGGYFGLGRPISIAVQPGSDLPIITFDDIEMFSTTIDYLIKVPVLSRIQLLDDDEFETIVRQSNPQPVIGLAERASQPFIFAAPDLGRHRLQRACAARRERHLRLYRRAGGQRVAARNHLAEGRRGGLRDG